MLSFQRLEIKYGYPTAYDLLLQIEKAAGIPSWTVADVDPEVRIAHAIRTQDAKANMPTHMAA